MDKIDYKKAFKELYAPKTTPSFIDITAMNFIQVGGKGDPNEPDGQYAHALELLYALTYTIKMSPKSGNAPKNYFEYVVPPLEGLWWLDENEDIDFSNKSNFCWISMIRQPEFVTNDVLNAAAETVKKKKPELDTSKARFTSFAEGLCVQCMHIGSYDDEPATITKMKDYTRENGYLFDLLSGRHHHEIYLSDPRKTEASKRKTILRYPVKKI
jgi:hypothetical protein